MRPVETPQRVIQSLDGFLHDTRERDTADEPFAYESARTLRIDVNGGVWLKPGVAIAYRGSLLFARRPTIGAGSVLDAVLREAGRFAAAVPLAETLLAVWLLARGGIASPKGAMTCGPARDGERLMLGANGTLSGALRSVPFAKGAKHLAVLARRVSGGSAVALVAASQARVTEATSIGGDPLNAVSFNSARPSAVKDAPAGLDAQALLLMGAAARAMHAD